MRYLPSHIGQNIKIYIYPHPRDFVVWHISSDDGYIFYDYKVRAAAHPGGKTIYLLTVAGFTIALHWSFLRERFNKTKQAGTH